MMLRQEDMMPWGIYTADVGSPAAGLDLEQIADMMDTLPMAQWQEQSKGLTYYGSYQSEELAHAFARGIKDNPAVKTLGVSQIIPTERDWEQDTATERE